MTTTQVVKTSVINNSLSEDYPHLDDHTRQTTDTPGFQPLTCTNTHSHQILLTRRPLWETSDFVNCDWHVQCSVEKLKKLCPNLTRSRTVLDTWRGSATFNCWTQSASYKGYTASSSVNIIFTEIHWLIDWMNEYTNGLFAMLYCIQQQEIKGTLDRITINYVCICLSLSLYASLPLPPSLSVCLSPSFVRLCLCLSYSLNTPPKRLKKKVT